MNSAFRRRASIPMAATDPHNLFAADSSDRLRRLAQQLRLYKPPPSPPSSSDDESDGVSAAAAIGGGGNRSIPGMGVPESAATTITRSKVTRFRPKRAAVLICLYEGESGEFRVILTKRSSNLSTHSGEVSLPGGKAEEGDVDDAATATREAKEEIGLDPSIVTVVSVLEPFLSKHLLRVVPVIGLLPNKQAFQPVANVAEVDAIFDAPLEMFLKDENHRSEEREWMGMHYVVHYFDYETEDKKFLIWGLTAGILIRAASVVYQRPPAFPEQNPIFKIPGNITGENLLP
ncbi:hypothetical protein QJS10_CPB20g01961 [Acorus calamus]|uniref:Nudix hydrolase domain-containing protein n=1 Tax=Acorus calamus TaxID=4465 RepID=A0AAV9C9E9_ACOCL|nr:hypothetical protein QJS10_CPB20g01961 [Acorus calamus]